MGREVATGASVLDLDNSFRAGLGGAIMVLAIIHFRHTALDIDSAETRPGSGDRMDIILGILLVILGAALFVYLSYTLISRI